MRTLPSWTVAIGAVLMLLYMLAMLPGEAAMVRAVEIELGLHRRCLDGDAGSCDARLLADRKLHSHVMASVDNVTTPGPCLVAGDEGIALRCDDVVLDISARAARLMQA